MTSFFWKKGFKYSGLKVQQASENYENHKQLEIYITLADCFLCNLSHWCRSTKGAYMFGRIDLCDFVLEHPTISRFHAGMRSFLFYICNGLDGS